MDINNDNIIGQYQNINNDNIFCMVLINLDKKSQLEAGIIITWRGRYCFRG
jgi:hypothetical protein